MFNKVCVRKYLCMEYVRLDVNSDAYVNSHVTMIPTHVRNTVETGTNNYRGNHNTVLTCRIYYVRVHACVFDRLHDPAHGNEKRNCDMFGK